jgi:uncharacterized membrane protein YuzA (DUF378 family)
MMEALVLTIIPMIIVPIAGLWFFLFVLPELLKKRRRKKWRNHKRSD